MKGSVHPASRLWSFDVWPALLYTALIFVVGSLPSPPKGPARLGDKAQHFLGFALLAWLSCRALRRLCPSFTQRGVWLGAFFASVVLGGVLELWQGLLTYRRCELLDWVADALGAALGVALGLAWSVVNRARTGAP